MLFFAVLDAEWHLRIGWRAILSIHLTIYFLLFGLRWSLGELKRNELIIQTSSSEQNRGFTIWKCPDGKVGGSSNGDSRALVSKSFFECAAVLLCIGQDIQETALMAKWRTKLSSLGITDTKIGWNVEYILTSTSVKLLWLVLHNFCGVWMTFEVFSIANR